MHHPDSGSDPARAAPILPGWEDADLFRALAESAPDATVVTDETGRIVLVNRQAKRLFGYSRRELLGADLEMLVPERYRGAHPFHRTRYLASPRPRPMGSGFDLFALRKDGSEFAAEISLSPVKRDGRVAVAAAIRDVTDRRRVEARIRESEARAREERLRAALAEQEVILRDEFLSVASHELRTPVGALALQLEVIRQLLDPCRAELDPRVPEKINRAQRSIGAITHLVEHVLDFSRISLDKFELNKGECDLGEIVAEVVTRHEELARQAGCRIEITGTTPLRGVWDRGRVEQVITNVLSNALKFGAGAPVEVNVQREENRARVTIRDHGPGLNPDEAERILGKFERAASHRNHGGLGLGLYITKQIIEAHGGTIRVNGGPGEGASFTITLPCADNAPPCADQGGSRCRITC